MKRLVILVAGGLIFAALACNLPTQSEPTALPPTDSPSNDEPSVEASATAELPDESTPEADPTLTPAVAVPSEDQNSSEDPGTETSPIYGDAIYETTFRSGWPPVTTDYGSSIQVDGGYQIEVVPDGAHWVFTSQANESVFYAELTAKPVSCPVSGGSYGIIFQYENTNAFRFFMVTCDNQYVLGERAGTRNRTITSGSLPDNSNMAQGEHTIGVWARETTISGYVDGQLADSTTFETMPAGDIGPYVETGEDAATIDFTRLAVYETGQ